MAPFYSILYKTSICRIKNSKIKNFSPLMPDEVREHLTRDQRHSFIQNHSRSFRFSAPWRWFSSVHLTYFLQGSGQRTRMAIAEAWFCAQWPILCCFWGFVWIIVQLEDSNMAHNKISNKVSHLFILYLLVLNRIHDAMRLNKMSRTSSRNIGPQH